MPADHVVYEDSPLGEYLKSAGDHVETYADNSDAPDSGNESVTSTIQFAPSARSAQARSAFSRRVRSKQHADSNTAITSNDQQRKLKPLRLGDKYSIRKLRFDFLFSAPLKRKLGHRENTDFLERFRYIIVTSQLLDENISVLAYGKSNENNDAGYESTTAADPFKKHHKRNFRYSEPTKFWVGSGGCIIVVAVLLSWLLRSGDSNKSSEGNTRCKMLIGLVLTAALLLFFYAHSWRKKLREIRKTALGRVSHFISCNQAFDINISRTIGIVQEIEFIACGYVLSGIRYKHLSTPSKFNREQSVNRARKCTRLRAQILSLLDLSLSLYKRSFNVLSKSCDQSDLEKYFDIYDLDRIEDVVLQDDKYEEGKPGEDHGRVEEQSEDGDRDAEQQEVSILFLKRQFRKLHHVRRKFLCCLLATSATGGSNDFASWKSVVQELHSLSDVMKKLADDLSHSLMQEDVTELIEFYTKEQNMESQFKEVEEEITNRPKRRSISPYRDQGKWKPHVQSLNSLSAALRNLEAKIVVIREDSVRLERQDARIVNSQSSTPVKANSGVSNVDLFLKRSSTGLGLSFETPESSRQAVSESIVRQYNNIGSDLKLLFKDWESGRIKLYDALNSTETLPSRTTKTYAEPEMERSPMSSLLSSPDSLISGTTFDTSTSAWSPSGSESGRLYMPDLDADGDDEYDENDDAGAVRLMRALGEGPVDTPVPMTMNARKVMVENIASAMVRNHERILRAT
ncbi:Mysoin-binding motif of peroxisomes-domain-containing protein [Lipomyces japonicus]|uniref:Mysoin-binding motif of peroxisomes-domain-containing protein n=1 Tax=Lipomyces japonicus TaxID=56871 RepID=UPI0034CD1199